MHQRLYSTSIHHTLVVRNNYRVCIKVFWFQLCTWRDDNHLKEIRWATATQLDGCYAYNAAQDGNKCIPCKSDVGSVRTLYILFLQSC